MNRDRKSTQEKSDKALVIDEFCHRIPELQDIFNLNKTNVLILPDGTPLTLTMINAHKFISNSKDAFVVKYRLPDTMQLELLENLLKVFEDRGIKMMKLYCNTFDEDGYCKFVSLSKLGEFSRLYDLPSPYMSFSIDFAGNNATPWALSIITNINSTAIDLCLVQKGNKAG